MRDTARKTYEKPVLVKAGELSKTTAVDHRLTLVYEPEP